MTDLRRIASAMGGEVQGNVASFPTPGHSAKDRGSWAYANPDAPDGVWIASGNGGDPLAIKDELRAKGVLPDREQPGEVWRVSGSYEFTDEAGAVLYRTRRHEHPSKPKRFTAERPDGNGGWINGLGDTPRVLYRLPELHKAINRAVLKDEPMPVVYLVEGERKADKLAAWGFLATSIAFGCKGWRKCYAEALAGCTVAILPDNDEPGRGFAETARAAIEAAGGRAHLIELPGLPPKGDVIDWTGTADELRALTDAAGNPPAKLLDLDDVVDWEGIEVPPRRWLLDGWLPIGEGALLTGAGSVGKSLVAQQLAATVAAGKPFMGVSVERARSLYITCEDGREEAQRRHKAIADWLGVRFERGWCQVRSWKGELDLELATFDAQRRMRPTERFKGLRETALATGIRFIVLDNTSHLFGGDENVKREVAAFVNLLNGLAAEIDGVVLLLGHPNKTGVNKPDAGDANQFGGSVTWENGFRSRAFMAAVPGDPDARELTNPKTNYSAKGNRLAFRWWKGAFVNEDDLPADTRAELAATIACNSENDAFLACLRARSEQGEGRGVGPAPGPNYAPAQFEGMAQARGLKKDALKRAMDRLFTIGRVETYEHRNSDKGRTVTLIREVSSTPERSPERLPNTIPERPLTVHPNDPAHTLYTTYNGRGPLGAAAPDDEDIDWGDNGERGE